MNYPVSATFVAATIDLNGNMYLSDISGGCIYKLPAGQKFISADANGVPNFVNIPSLPVSGVQTFMPTSLVADNANLYVAVRGLIYSIPLNSSGITSLSPAIYPTVDGITGGNPNKLGYNISSITLDSSGNLVVADILGRINKITTSGSFVSNMIDTRNSIYNSMVFDNNDVLYVSDNANKLIGTIASGVCTPIVTSINVGNGSLAVDLSNNLYYGDVELKRVMQRNNSGTTTVFAYDAFKHVVDISFTPGSLTSDSNGKVFVTSNFYVFWIPPNYTTYVPDTQNIYGSYQPDLLYVSNSLPRILPPDATVSFTVGENPSYGIYFGSGGYFKIDEPVFRNCAISMYNSNPPETEINISICNNVSSLNNLSQFSIYNTGIKKITMINDAIVQPRGGVLFNGAYLENNYPGALIINNNTFTSGYLTSGSLIL